MSIGDRTRKRRLVRTGVLRACFWLLASAGLAGCVSGGAPLQYHLIEPVDAEPLPGADDAAPRVAVRDLLLPQYLERMRVATRVADGRVTYSETHRWGESLRQNLLRTLARNLGARLGTADIGTPHNRSASTPDHLIVVHVDRFERDADGRVRLAARWQLIDSGGQASVATHRLDLDSGERVAAGDYDAIVMAMRALFGQLSTRIAESVLAHSDAAERTGGDASD